MSVKDELLDILAEYDNSQIDEKTFVDKAIAVFEKDDDEKLERAISLEFIMKKMVTHNYNPEGLKYESDPNEDLGYDSIKFARQVIKGINDAKK